MKTFVSGLIILLFASANVAAAGSPKVGYVSVEKILTEAPQVQAVNDSMVERFGSRKTELQEMEKEINELQENFKRNELVLQSIVNLIVFVFIMTALVYVLQVCTNPKITNYVDALYFTIATLTTTGFGDITLQGTTGRLLAIVIMVVGVGLFLRLVRALFRPPKVNYRCPSCGLSRHDTDAVHCKACGEMLNITDEGD